MKKLPIRLTLALLLISILPLPARAIKTLIPMGEVVGLELYNDTVTIAGFEKGSRAEEAGLQTGDRLLAVDGNPVKTAGDIRAALERSDGTVELTVRRKDQLLQKKLEPLITDSGPKLGIYLRQGITGIGTLTYYDPETGIFGSLGHSVNDHEGTVVAMTAGNLYSAAVASVRKGRCGDPGQLMGALRSAEPIGILQRNTVQGVFGKLNKTVEKQPLPAASDSIRPGNATILSTVSGTAVQSYSVEILKIYPTSRQSGRNMLIKITDPALLETTGGIVQGMSGSPIIQDGKLIGAVTHVLVNDPTTGYGIFIENMLDAAA
ncbi:MAG: PDZ domain-containing protein [Oscillospiraceae bacterium]|nr:PDZ domain-containing protein [Oscillospiraceae bacterium]